MPIRKIDTLIIGLIDNYVILLYIQAYIIPNHEKLLNDKLLI